MWRWTHAYWRRRITVRNSSVTHGLSLTWLRVPGHRTGDGERPTAERAATMSWYEQMMAAGRSKSLTTGNIRHGVAAVHEVLGSPALETPVNCHSELMGIRCGTSSQCSSEWSRCVKPRSNFPVLLSLRKCYQSRLQPRSADYLEWAGCLQICTIYCNSQPVQAFG